MIEELSVSAPMASGTTIEGSRRESRRFLPALALLFIGSGCAALIYEIVWLQLISLQIGASAVSLGVLLGTFMGGMCLGSLLFPRFVSRAAHPLRVYAMLEIGIGIVGLLELALVPFVSDLYVHFATTGMVSILLRALFAGVCLLPPTILMGATLPAIARWVEATPRGVSWLGFFYGGNILGAVFGCLLAGFYLLPTYDMKTATLWAAAINGGVAVLGLLLSTITTHEQPNAQARAASVQAKEITAGDAWSVYLTIAISGLTGLGSEVVWTRLLSLMLGATVYTFSNILAVFLLGLGFGSAIGSFLARTSQNPRAALAWCQFLLAGSIAWAAYAFSNSLPFWPVDPQISSSPWFTFQVDLARCFWAVFPGALLWGASFPLALAAIARRGQDPGRLVGSVYAANTVGAIIGALAFSMIVIPSMGTQGAQRLLIGCCALSGLIAILPVLTARQKGKSSGNPIGLAVGMALALGVAFWLGLSVEPPHWGAVAFGRNSAYYMHSFYPPMMSKGDIDLIQEANNMGLKSLTLASDGTLKCDEADGPSTPERDANQLWLRAHNDKLVQILRERKRMTGVANILAYGDEAEANRYCSFVGEGMNVSVCVTYDDSKPENFRYFHGAGKVQASSNPADMRLQRMLGHITALTTLSLKDPKDVLVVACGAGVTAGSFVPYGSNITIVDIEPMVPKFVTPQFAKENYSVIPDDVASDKVKAAGYKGYDKTKVIIDDGRHFIKTTDKKFDIITSDPIDPWVKGCAALNTVEYYEMCKSHLKPGGVVALWIPLYESSDETAKSVICTFFKVFPNGIVWSNENGGAGYDAVLYAKVGEDGGVDKPAKIDIDEMQAYIDAHRVVKESLADVGFNSGHNSAGQPVAGACEAVELLATYAGTGTRMTKWSANTENLINYDSNLRLQYIAGLGINEEKADAIFKGILHNYQFPDDIFTGSPERIAALKNYLEASGRVDQR